MKLVEFKIAGAWLLENKVLQDSRGEFSRVFCASALKNVLESRTIVQVNHSITHQVGAIRGMHYQYFPHAEMKIVRCIKGKVYDVLVDLRQNSPTFLQWIAVELTSKNYCALVIPEGCAHGFQVLEKHSELLYLQTAFYTPNKEGAVRFDDPLIGIDWPLEPTDLSTRDMNHPYLNYNFKGVYL